MLGKADLLLALRVFLLEDIKQLITELNISLQMCDQAAGGWGVGEGLLRREEGERAGLCTPGNCSRKTWPLRAFCEVNWKESKGDCATLGDGRWAGPSPPAHPLGSGLWLGSRGLMPGPS